jgi:hypothetical protein
MRFNPKHLHRYVLVAGALVALSCAPSGAWAQQNGNQDQTQATAQGQAQGQFQARSDDWVAFNQFLDAHPDIANALKANPDLLEDQNFLGQHPDFKNFCDNHPLLRQDLDRDRVGFHHWFQFRHEVAAMNLFLDGHPFIDSRLTADPSLINNQSFVQANTSLADFLNSHPQVQRAFDQNPALFMSADERFEGSPAGFRQNLFVYSQFAKNNPNIAKQLEANPSLIDNKTYVDAHVSLRVFLGEHPEVAQQIDQNPAQFMQAEVRFENNMGNPGSNNGFTRGQNPNPDLTRGEVASMEQFLSQNPKIDQQLQANPSLINNVKYLNAHPQLRAFLDSNPQIREAFTQNPSLFMQRENQFATQGNGSGQVARMDAYLDKHPNEARELNAYPARINDSDYLSHHKDLQAFLKRNPEVREQFMSNPSAFMRQESTFDACAQMDDFLNAHKKIAKDLDQNPANVKDTAFLDHHKDLKHFFDKNPGVNDQFQTDPHGFWYREQHFEAERQMDVYFSTHRGVAKDLQKNPDRVKDANYLDHHKDLKELMNKNPQLEEAANTNPSAFMQEQMKFHEEYMNQQQQQKTKVQEQATVHSH